jgi:hypothetical protein
VHPNPSRIVHGTLALTLLGSAALPLLGAVPSQLTRESRAQPFPTVVPVQPEFDGPFEETPPAPIDFEGYLPSRA